MNSTPDVPSQVPAGAPMPQGPATAGWLSGPSLFEKHDKRKMGPAMTFSLVFHGALFALALFIFAVRPDIAQDIRDEVTKVVYLQEPGPGGGGGGSPSPAPPKKMEIPKVKAPEPITPPPVVPPPTPAPVLTAPIMTNTADLVQATGANAVSLAAYAGGGRGTGVGSGTGNGVGPGTGGGFGGGAYRSGSGIKDPSILKAVQPKYTTEAMRAKVQGVATVEAVVNADGTVGDVRLAKSLDKNYGLDQEALRAAKAWLFRPGVDRDGKPVPVIVLIELQFTLH